MSSADAPAPTVLFKRGKRPAKQLQQKRTRQLSDSDSDGDDDSTTLADAASVAKKLRGGKPSAAFTSSTGGGAAAKRRKEAATAEAENAAAAGISKLDHAYQTSGTAASIVVDSATRRLDVDGEEATDGGGTAQPPSKVLAGDAAESADNIYRGLNSYNEYVNKRTTSVTQSNASRIRAGPLRGATNVRLSTRFDYQPDICKDYKETGYCGFGDSCIFMHDRGDYKTGWQLDKEWDEKQKAGAEKDKDRFLIRSDDEGEDDGSGSDDDLPFACVICRNEFKDPIVTKCGHYFCESCALKQHSKSVKCFICGAATQGLFKPATDIQAKITAKKKRIAEREAEIRAQNGDIEIESD
ncbi:hypothetical protein HDU86_001863 [Geranomyces michiganensis]|nr:hypothetical protein HDU86_001863 [Geranomyces michiganensis]